MASLEVKGISEALAALDVEAERVKRNGPAAVAAGAAVAIAALQAAAPVATGTLQGSIMEVPGARTWNSTKVQPNGFYTGRGGSGKRKRRVQKSRYRSENPVRTMTVAAILEYGTSKRPARAWIRGAVESCGNAVADAMMAEIMRD